MPGFLRVRSRTPPVTARHHRDTVGLRSSLKENMMGKHDGHKPDKDIPPPPPPEKKDA